MISKSYFQEQIQSQKIVRGYSQHSFSKADMKWIVKSFVETIERIVRNREATMWDDEYGWDILQKESKPIPRLEKFVQRSQDKIYQLHPISFVLTKRRNPVYFFFENENRRKDRVYVPEMHRYINSKLYYGIVFHEFSHALFSPNRLNKKFPTDDIEEMTVELSALIILFLHGINLWKPCVGYIQNRAYGEKRKKEDHILYVKSSRDWNAIIKNTQALMNFYYDCR